MVMYRQARMVLIIFLGRAGRTQEFGKKLSRISQGVCCKLVLSVIATGPSEGVFRTWDVSAR
jgi:hypothetical protein